MGIARGYERGTRVVEDEERIKTRFATTANDPCKKRMQSHPTKEGGHTKWGSVMTVRIDVPLVKNVDLYDPFRECKSKEICKESE